MSTAAELLPELKNRLDITWDDEQSDYKLLGMLARGIAYLNSAVGAELDYLSEAMPKSLLFQYCIYDRSNALSEFQQAYLHELLSLQIQTELHNGKETTTDGI